MGVVFGSPSPPSSPLTLAASTMYTHSSWFLNDSYKMVDVYVYSTRFGELFLGQGVQHCIVCSGVGDGKWRVFEGGRRGMERYACDYISGHKCRYLGRRRLGEVWLAAIVANDVLDDNCNRWTEYVARELGWNITIDWNCSCVRH